MWDLALLLARELNSKRLLGSLLSIRVANLGKVIWHNWLVPFSHGSMPRNLVAGALDDNIPAVFEIFGDRWGVVVDPNGDTASTIAHSRTHFSNNPSDARHFQGGADHHNSIWTFSEIILGDCADSLIVWVVLIVEHHSRAHSADPVAAFALVVRADIVNRLAVRTKRRDRPSEQFRVQCRNFVTFGAHLGVEAPVQLDSPWPFAILLLAQWNAGLQWRKSGVNAVDILRV